MHDNVKMTKKKNHFSTPNSFSRDLKGNLFASMQRNRLPSLGFVSFSSQGNKVPGEKIGLCLAVNSGKVRSSDSSPSQRPILRRKCELTKSKRDKTA